MLSELTTSPQPKKNNSRLGTYLDQTTCVCSIHNKVTALLKQETATSDTELDLTHKKVGSSLQRSILPRGSTREWKQAGALTMLPIPSTANPTAALPALNQAAELPSLHCQWGQESLVRTRTCGLGSSGDGDLPIPVLSYFLLLHQANSHPSNPCIKYFLLRASLQVWAAFQCTFKASGVSDGSHLHLPFFQLL